MVTSAALPDPDKTRRTVGCILYILAMLVGGGLLAFLFLLVPLLEPNAATIYSGMCVGAVLAVPAGLMYLTVPRLLDRYDPEPWYGLVGCFMWGAFAACGFSATINSLAGAVAGQSGGEAAAAVVGAVVSAPLVEEFWKGFCVLGVFYFLRREFDGVVDGIIYATFTALGFAMMENIIYYGRAAAESGEALTVVFVLRGILGPWGHPLYTSMTGIGLGLARESGRTSVKILAPLTGYLGAVFLHGLWNGSATLFDVIGGEEGIFYFLGALVLWLVFVVAFLVIVIVLVRRRGKIIRQYLVDEVAIGTITAGELELVASAFGLLKARMRHGKRGSEFVRAVARLALSKWHSARAHMHSKHTISMEFIGPLRQRIRELKAQVQ